MNFKDQTNQDLDAFFNTDEFADRIHWDQDTIIVVTEDLESRAGDEIGTRVERKKVLVRQAAIHPRPASGDEILLNFDPVRVEQGAYWTVETVADPPGIYEIVFYRYVS